MDKSQQKLNILNQIMEESQDENNLSSEGWLTIENMHLDVEGKILSETIIDLDNKEILKIIMYGGYPYEVDEEVAYTREGNLIQDKDNIYIDYVVLDNQKLKEELGNLNDWFLIKNSDDGTKPEIEKKIEDFTIYTNLIVKYKNIYLLDLSPQENKILITLLDYSNSYLDFSTLRDIAGLTASLDRSTVSKYVNKVKLILEKKTNKTVVNKKDVGWKIENK